MTLILFILSVGVAVMLLTAVLMILAGKAAPSDCAYVLVLGSEVNSVSLQERIDYALGYLTEHPDTVAVLSGGKTGDSPLTEAEAMRQALTEGGIDPNRLWLEDRANSTWTNLGYCMALLEQRIGSCPARVGILTHDFHMFRATMLAGEKALAVTPIPVPTGNPLRWLGCFVREIAGVWHYIILGGFYS